MCRILVVDDDEKLLNLIKAGLKLDGFELIGALSGKEALKKVVTQDVNLIILDIKMPEMDGFEVLERLKDSPATSSIPVVMLTTCTQPSYREKAFALGASDYINKPFERTILTRRIRKVLTKHNQSVD